MEEEDKVAKYPPLRFAMTVTERANAAWEDGSFIESVTPTTRALLTYWFDEAYVDMRELNFHIDRNIHVEHQLLLQVRRLNSTDFYLCK